MRADIVTVILLSHNYTSQVKYQKRLILHDLHLAGWMIIWIGQILKRAVNIGKKITVFAQMTSLVSTFSLLDEHK